MQISWEAVNEPANKVISEDLDRRLLELANTVAKDPTSGSVSPSGTKQLIYTDTKDGGLAAHVVDRVGPPPSPEIREAAIKVGKVRRAAVKPTLRKMQQSDTDLSHAEKTRTIENVMDEMSSEQRDLMDVIIGAAIEDDDISGDSQITAKYDALSTEHKNVINYVVGILLSETSALKHSDIFSDEELMHYGVKGMQWGVRKEYASGSYKAPLSKTVSSQDRQVARAKVKAGSATLGDAHVASLKSTGHRALNLVSGDKTYWKRTAIIGGGLAAGSAAVLTAPLVLPSSTLAAVGAATIGTTGFGGAVTYSSSLLAAVGAGAIAEVGGVVAGATAGAATILNVAGNTARAIGGNARVDRSYATLGKSMMKNQVEGNNRVNKILNKSGSISKKNLRQDDMSDVDNFLAHYGVPGMRWGLRRTEAVLAARREKSIQKLGAKQEKLDSKAAKLGIPKKTGSSDDGGDSPKTSPVKLSADAERFVKTHQKSPSEMSDREIKETVNRANSVKQYNDLFSPDPNKELAQKVSALQLQKQYSQLQREMNPTRTQKITRFVSGQSDSFKAFKELDKATDGAMSKQMKAGLAVLNTPKKEPKHRADTKKEPKHRIDT